MNTSSGAFFYLPQLLISIFLLILGVIVLIKNKTRDLNKIFFLLSFFTSLWLFSYFLAYKSTDIGTAYFWFKMGYTGIPFIGVSGFYYTVSFLRIEKMKKCTIFLYLGAILVGALIWGTHWIIDDLENFSWGHYPSAGKYHPIFLIFFVGLVSVACSLLMVSLFNVNKFYDNLQRTQIKYLLLAFSIYSSASIDFLPNYGVAVYPFGYIFVLVYMILISHTIIKYRLMDISIVMTRTGIFVLVYSFVLGIPFNIAFGLQAFLKDVFKEEWWIFPLVVSTVLATIGPYIYIYIQRKAEDKLLQEQRQYQATLRQASLGMGQIKDLKRLLNLIVHVVTRAVKIENCKIFLRHEDSKRFVLKAVKGEKNNIDEKNHLGFDSLLVNYFNQVKEPIVYEEIKQRRRDIGGEGLKEIETILEKIDAALVVPSFIEQKLIAIISLGKKRSGKLYSHDDLAVFAILANQSALAIENAQFYEDMKRTHVQLLKAEKMATVGTMADGLSHQINNRLHAMGFIAGDLIDTIRHGKQNGHSPRTKELLEEIENGLERIQQNVKHGGEIVGGLLRYTRKGEKGFAPVELSQLLKSALEMAQFKIKVNMLDIEKHFDDSIPKIKGNFTQLQEVFFNLIDNAYDAMMQRKEELQENGYKPHLDIYAREVNAKIEIIIQDNGMGVKESDMHKLFTPFFTTKATSKKGTGLGLYVIRQIIEDNHGGKVNFSSKFKIGSETQIILPIALEKVG